MRILFFSLVLLFFAACGNEEIKFEVTNTEAFAFDIGDSWEINATARVKGFNQKEDEETGMYSASLPFTVDLVRPDGNKIEKVFASVGKEVRDEEFMDMPLEVQFELDSTFSEGEYKLIFNVTDSFNEEHNAVAETVLNLEE